MAFHHSSIRKYTAALLDFFNGTEVQYNDSVGTTVIRSVPIVYSSREKSRILDDYTSEQFRSGNYNVLPRANLSLSTMNKSEQRSTNKLNKINTTSKAGTIDYMYNSVPYEFTYELAILCRGMNEATQIVEQLAPKFNPIVNIDVWDAQNLNEPTRVPLKMLDISIEQEEYEVISTNLVTVSIGLSIIGNLYPPIQSADRIKTFRIKMNGFDEGAYSTDLIHNWDVDTGGNALNERTTTFDPTRNFAPVIIDIVPTTPLTVAGPNELTVIYSDADNTINELTFDWVLIQGDGTITGNLDKASVILNAGGTVEPQITITDIYGNYTTLSKVFVV